MQNNISKFLQPELIKAVQSVLINGIEIHDLNLADNTYASVYPVAINEIDDNLYSSQSLKFIHDANEKGVIIDIYHLSESTRFILSASQWTDLLQQLISESNKVKDPIKTELDERRKFLLEYAWPKLGSVFLTGETVHESGISGPNNTEYEIFIELEHLWPTDKKVALLSLYEYVPELILQIIISEEDYNKLITK